jgi:hypothetical protein
MNCIDSNFKQKFGETIEEKVNNLKNMLKYLQDIGLIGQCEIEVKDIIYSRDNIAVIQLLELMYELVNLGLDKGTLNCPKINLFD